MDYYKSKVQMFSQIMVKQLRENDHKTGWDDCDESYLLQLLKQEVKELSEVVNNINPFMPASKFPGQKQLKELAVEEAADVANFCMMIADVCEGLEK